MTSSIDLAKFWERVETTHTCWLWKGAIDGKGYGRMWPTAEGHYLAHRWSYETLVAPIPEKLQIDHLCRVRHCVNPAHLEPVTQYENWMRGESVSAIGARRTHCLKGHEYNEINTYYGTEGKMKGTRQCRICNAASVQARRLRIKAAQKAAQSDV